MDEHDVEIIRQFVDEAREHLSDIENQFLTMEEQGADVDGELVDAVFRGIHSIKGCACFFSFNKVADLSHSMENILNLVRKRTITPSTDLVDALLKAADTLRSMINNIFESNAVAIENHLEALNRLSEPASKNPPALTKSAPPTPQSTEAAVVAAPIRPDDEQSKALVPSLSVDDRPAIVIERSESAPQDAAESSPPTQTAGGASTAVANDPTVRVSIRLLDRLMNLAGELVLARNRMLQVIATREPAALDTTGARIDVITSELQEAIMQTRMQPVGNVFSKFPRIVRDLAKKLGKECQLQVEGNEVELDKTILEAIGDPLTHLIRNAVDHGIEAPAKRTQRGKKAEGTLLLRAFHEAGKVNISLSDDGGGIDAARVRAKAIQQGLLTADQAAQLSETEVLRYIFEPGFSTAEQVTDVSGRGVGMDVVRTNLEKVGGVVDLETVPGAGTVVRVKLPLTLSIIPALGVRCGHDFFEIPQVNIVELVRLRASQIRESILKVGDAAVLRLRESLLPLVRLSDVLGADSQYMDAASLTLLPDRRRSIADRRAVDLAAGPERTLASDSANRGNDRRSDAPAGAMNIVVVDAGLVRYGLIVDSLADTAEIVVKPFGRHLKNCSYLAGATILGSGQVALILDIAGLAQKTKIRPVAQEKLKALEESQRREDTQPVLLFTNDRSEYFAIPMGIIARIERIRTERIDSVGGRDVMQYGGNSLSLLCLEKQIQAKPRVERGWCHVVVFAVGDREVGLIAPELVDIVQATTELDTLTFREKGVLGSFVIRDKTCRFLDLYELAEAAYPAWFARREPPKPKRAARILLAEDSNFFRQHLKEFIVGRGYEVLDAEDGQAAWDALQVADPPVDMVVTDIEMPRMNGYDFVKKIRSEPRWSKLPVVALSSLAGEQDIERGKSAGVDEYHVKLDRDQLGAALARLLRA